MKPEMMLGPPWQEGYMRISPYPEEFNRLFAKKTEIDRRFQDLEAETIHAIKAPTLLMIGDSDIIRPEPAVAPSAIPSQGCRIHGLPCSPARPM